MVGKDEFIDAYEILGIQVEASETQIKRAYRQCSLKVHPDRVSDVRTISVSNLTVYISASK